MSDSTTNSAELALVSDTPSPRSWQRLETAGDCRRFFRWLLLEVKKGRLDLKKANSLAFIGSHLLRAVEVSDLEQKIAKLEGDDHNQPEDRVIKIYVGGKHEEPA